MEYLVIYLFNHFMIHHHIVSEAKKHNKKRFLLEWLQVNKSSTTSIHSAERSEIGSGFIIRCSQKKSILARPPTHALIK